MTISIAAVNALAYEREIKELFQAHDRPEFPGFFDRAYPAAFGNGATSWLGRDRTGQLVMHVACFPRRFRFRGRDVVAGLMVNLMVAKEHRSFFPALALINHVIQDLRTRGVCDFLYTDPNEQGRSLLRATPFARIGTLRRYVLPVADGRAYVDAAIRLFHGFLRAMNGVPSGTVVLARPARQYVPVMLGVPHEQLPQLRAYHDDALYVSRMTGYPGEDDWWFTCERSGASGSPEAALLIRGPDASGLAVLQAVRRTPGFALPSLLPAVVPELRRRGWRRLHVMTIAESDFGRHLRRCGFVPRRDAVPVFATAFTPLGESCIHSVRDWEITDLECDRGV